MEIKVQVQYHDGRTYSIARDIEVAGEALEEVSHAFNPSNNDDVAIAKVLAAAFITHVDRNGRDGRLCAIARTDMMKTSMVGVKAITHGT